MAIDVHRTSGTARIHRFGIIDLVVLVVTNGLLINTRKQHINMKYKLFTHLHNILLMALLPCVLYAHAGMMDRWLQERINVVGVFKVILFIQITMGFFCFRWRSCKLNLCLKKISQYYTSHKGFALFCTWLLSSFVTTPYLIELSMPFLFLAFIPIFIIFIVYTYIIWKDKIREKITTSHSIYYMLHFLVQHSIAYIIYPFVYDTYIFRLFVYYTDEEYSSAEYKLYPEIDGLYDIADHIIFFTLMFSIPYLFLSLKQIYKWINHITT